MDIGTNNEDSETMKPYFPPNLSYIASMKEAPEIIDYGIYNSKMARSNIDKLFFADKIETSIVVDFGCADGSLMKNYKLFMPTVEVVGYDNDPQMVAHSTPEFPIFSAWEDVIERIQGKYQPTVVISSLMHEVFHYCSKTEIDAFWRRIFGSGFHYIVIRDMAPSRSIDRVANINDVKKIYNKFLGEKVLSDFERIWGSIENNRQMVHFLLKYKYILPNWDREVRENYFPITREELLARIPPSYDVTFHEHFVLPYIRQSVKDDTGIELKDPTHLKLILQAT